MLRRILSDRGTIDGAQLFTNGMTGVNDRNSSARLGIGKSRRHPICKIAKDGVSKPGLAFGLVNPRWNPHETSNYHGQHRDITANPYDYIRPKALVERTYLKNSLGKTNEKLQRPSQTTTLHASARDRMAGISLLYNKLLFKGPTSSDEFNDA
jgi:hypothetical protein